MLETKIIKLDKKIQSKIPYKQNDDILQDDSQGLRTSENCHNF